MKNLMKLFLYPLLSIAVIAFVVLLDYGLTWFFSWIFNCSIHDVACSPMMLIYICSGVAIMYLIVNVCQIIHQEL